MAQFQSDISGSGIIGPIGVSAQSFQTLLPEAIVSDKDGFCLLLMAMPP
jgi:hypothetical protein